MANHEEVSVLIETVIKDDNIITYTPKGRGDEAMGSEIDILIIIKGRIFIIMGED